MSNVFAVLWFITLFAFIILRFVKRSKRIAAGDNYKADPVYLKVSKIKRIVGIICLLCPFACLIAAPKTQDRPPVEQVQVQQEQDYTDAEKQEMQKYWDNIKKMDNGVQKAWQDGWSDTLTSLANGNITIYQAYSNIKKLQDFTEKSWQYAEHMKTPDFLHGEDKETIRKANRAYADALYSQCSAAKEMVEVLNTGKLPPSTLESIQNKINSASAGRMAATAAIMTVTMSMGIVDNAEQ